MCTNQVYNLYFYIQFIKTKVKLFYKLIKQLPIIILFLFNYSQYSLNLGT